MSHRLPGPLDVVIIIAIVLAVTNAVRLAGGNWVTDAWTGSGLAVISAVTVGLPGMFWAIANRPTRWQPFAAIGAAAGALMPICFLLAAAIGLAVRWGIPYAQSVLTRRAPLPVYGSVGWSAFVTIVLTSAVVGCASGAIFWLASVKGRRSPGLAALLSVFVIGGAMVVTYALRQTLVG